MKNTFLRVIEGKQKAGMERTTRPTGKGVSHACLYSPVNNNNDTWRRATIHAVVL